MTKHEIKQAAKRAFENIGKIGRIQLDDIILLEYAENVDSDLDYVLFRNNFTGREYSVCYLENGDVFVIETNTDELYKKDPYITLSDLTMAT